MLRTPATALRKGLQPQFVGLSTFISKLGQDAVPNHHGAQEDTERGNAAKVVDQSLYVAVKDNIATSSLYTTCASKILEKHESPFEATVVQSLRKYGASIMGKTNMDEFGMGSHSTHSYFGPVLNNLPYNSYSVGGSSGGSAVAVVTNQCDVALGTDTGGSVRLPAAYTGIIGFKPSYGLISRWGVVPYANSLDTVGILARSTRAILEVFKRTRKHDPQDPTSLSESTWGRMQSERKRLRINLEDNEISREEFSQLKIGIPLEYNISELDAGIQGAWENVLEFLQDQGCSVVPVSLPNTKHALSAYYVLAAAEATSNLSKYDGVRYGSSNESSDGSNEVLHSQTRGEGFGDEVKRRILLGSYTLSSKAIDNYFIQAQKVRRLVQRDFDRVFALPNPLQPPQQFDLSDLDDTVVLENKLGPPQVDLIICPTAPTPPPTIEEVSKQAPVDTYMNDVFTVPASLAGLPAISLPVSMQKSQPQSGRPDWAGIQVIGQYSDDFRVLRAAELLSQIYPHFRRQDS